MASFCVMFWLLTAFSISNISSWGKLRSAAFFISGASSPEFKSNWSKCYDVTLITSLLSVVFFPECYIMNSHEAGIVQSLIRSNASLCYVNYSMVQFYSFRPTGTILAKSGTKPCITQWLTLDNKDKQIAQAKLNKILYKNWKQLVY